MGGGGGREVKPRAAQIITVISVIPGKSHCSQNLRVAGRNGRRNMATPSADNNSNEMKFCQISTPETGGVISNDVIFCGRGRGWAKPPTGGTSSLKSVWSVASPAKGRLL